MVARQQGFTLTELMTVVAILAILAAIAVPNMGTMVRTQRVKTASFDIYAALTLARSEAVKRNVSVTVTPSAGDWAQGWTVADANGNVVRRQEGYTNIAIAGPATVTYSGTGRLSAAGVPAPFAISAPDLDAMYFRCISLDVSGRPNSIKGACGSAAESG